jgi:hypothetical protein
MEDKMVLSMRIQRRGGRSMLKGMVYMCHKPPSSQYRCFCDEKEEMSYCKGCRFWYPELAGVQLFGLWKGADAKEEDNEFHR